MKDYVKKFEKNYGLKQDGILSPEDQEILFSGQVRQAGKKGGLKSIQTGSLITFGHYEQDGNETNGQESITWLVLEKKGNRILVISQYALDCQPYNSSNCIS